MRWRWPPLRLTPRSPTTVSRPCRRVGHEVVGAGQPQRLPQGGLADVVAEGDVVADRAGEEERLLEHDRHGPGGHGDGAGRRRRPARRRSRRACSCPIRSVRRWPRCGRLRRRGRRRRAPARDSPGNVNPMSSSRTPMPSGGGGRCAGAGSGSIGSSSTSRTRRQPATRVRQLRQGVADQAQREHEQREQVDEARHVADGDVAAAHAEGAEQDEPDVGHRRAARRAAPRTCRAAAPLRPAHVRRRPAIVASRSVSRCSAP